MKKPDYVPPCPSPVWLSSADVITAIRELHYNGADKAFCWDMFEAVLALEKVVRDRARGAATIHNPTATSEGA